MGNKRVCEVINFNKYFSFTFLRISFAFKPLLKMFKNNFVSLVYLLKI